MTPPPCDCAHVEQIIVWTRGRSEPIKQRHDRCIHPSGPHPMNEFCQWRTPKTCIHCQQSKPLDAFRKSARMIGGRENGCKDCHNERRRARYQADPSATLSRNRKWFQANREKLNAYHREWRNRLDVNRRTAKRREEIAGLADSYVKQLLAGGVLSHSDIPQPLVEAQRELLKIKRYLHGHSV